MEMSSIENCTVIIQFLGIFSIRVEELLKIKITC